MPNLKKSLPFIFIPIIFLIVAFFILFFNQKSATLKIHVAPTNAVVTIKNKTYKNNTEVSLKPGNYSVTISAPNFEPQTLDLSLARRDSIDLSAYLLSANSDFSYYETNANDLYYLREYFHHHPDDEPLSSFLTSYDKNLSIHDILPLYNIDSSTGDSYYIFFETSLPNCSRLYCLKIGASSKPVAESALNALHSAGFNPDNYEIIYTYDR